MKKLLAMVMAGSMAMSMAVYADRENSQNVESLSEALTETDSLEVLGAWETDQTGSLTEEAEHALAEATRDLVGAEYAPISLLASQPVSGTNYAILCRITPVVPNATGSISVVYVYEDLNGNAEVTNIQDLAESGDETASGGWAVIGSDESETAQRARKALETALEDQEGADYEAVTALSAQIVAGEYYQLLCRITPVYPDALGTYNIVTVFEDLEGTCEIVTIRELEYSVQ